MAVDKNEAPLLICWWAPTFATTACSRCHASAQCVMFAELDATRKLRNIMEGCFESAEKECEELNAELFQLKWNANASAMQPGEVARKYVGDNFLRDPDNPCDIYEEDAVSLGASCETDGHYLCNDCKHNEKRLDKR